MGNSYYDIDCINEELEIYSVRKRPRGDNPSGIVYTVTKTDDGWYHECKSRSVYGNTFICRHIKMVIQKYYTNTPYKHLFNISPKRTNSKNINGKSTDS